jgi:hypothetical protein
MVSLEEKQSYLQQIDTNPKLSAFKNLLCGQFILFPTNNIQISDTDKIYYEVTTAIQTNNKDKFVEFFNKKNKSIPSEDDHQPFIYDDFLIFSLIIGIVKFGCDKEWIKNVIAVRVKNDITITFENILNDNFNHSDNNKNIVFMYFYMVDQTKITSEFTNEVLQNINVNTQIFQNKNDFIIICTLLSYNRIIELKEWSGSKDMAFLKLFEVKFIKRIKILAWIIQSIILSLMIYSIYKVISIRPEIKTLFDKIGSIFKITAIFGISQVGNILPWLKGLFFRGCLILFGYPNDLIRK